tara:strand:+ start:2232 stop:3014 length:783 start_codon:yes stop_codon:yes gene_type:complete
MKSKFYFFIAIFIFHINFYSQNVNPFQPGEWFKYKITYSGIFKAGEATVELTDGVVNNKKVFHAKMNARSTGAINLFFKVKDRYESFFTADEIIPLKFIRDIDEGGHTKSLNILFDHTKSSATVIDFKKNKRINFATKKNIQDMVSIFYYLRSFFKMEDLNVNNEISVNMFFDSENYVLKVKYLKSEFINTTFGKVYCYKIQPYVQSGRVFKKDESLTMWITADKNRVPIKMKADLLVGSIKIDLESFSSLTYPFELQFD